jgi:effector-binding domain-containing protein
MSYREIFNKQLNRPVLSPQLKQELKQSILEDVSAFLSGKKNMRETISELLHKQKQKEIENNYNRLLQYERKYLKYIYLDGVDFKKLSVSIKPCETEWEKELWTYARIVVSSAPHRGYVGRIMNFLMFDENSNKLLGILGFGSDFIKLPPRDRYIGIHHSEVNKIQYLTNMYVCVSVEPFSMLTGGKLLALLAPSNLIRDYYIKKYEQPIYGITTTSLFGESIQYDRLWDPKTILARWKYLGLTSGNATVIHFSPKTRKLMNKASKQLGIVLKKSQSRPTTAKIIRILSELGLKREDAFPEKCLHKRGVYFCWLINETDIFRKDLKTYTYINRPEQEIYNYWYKRWFERRYNNYKDKLKPKDYSLPKKEMLLGRFIQETPITFGFEDEIIFNFADDDIVFNFE